MKPFKFLTNNEESSLNRYLFTPVNQEFYTTLTISPTGGLTTINTTNTLNEYCFQFNNNEPVVFATGRDPLTITLSNNQSNITFNDNNNTFTLFSRPDGTI
jgi:hypothetical protein